MSTASEGWYISEPDGEAVGPMTRDELVRQHAERRYSAAALGWHVDISEWRPLARLATAGSSVEAVPQRAPEAMPQSAKSQKRGKQQGAKPAGAGMGGGTAGTTTGGAGTVKSHGATAGSAGTVKSHGAAAASLPHESKRLLSHLQNATTAEERKRLLAQGAAQVAGSEAGERALLAVRRAAARLIDMFSLGVLAACVLWALALKLSIALNPGTALPMPTPALLMIAAALALVPVETALLAAWGTTPGKALLGLSVRDAAGKRPGFAAAWERTRQVFVRGVALGIPVLSAIAALIAFGKFSSTGTTAWDQAANLRVHGPAIPSGRWQLVLVALVGSLAFANSEITTRIVLELLGWG